MAYVFDSLGYARRLREAGIPLDQAEAHADALREFVMADLATKPDLLATKQELMAEMEHQTLRLTIRLGGIVAIGVAILATIIKL